MSNPTPTARQYLRIGQIAKRSGVSAKALRLYEQRGLLKPCTHSEAGYRLYGPDALRRLMQIVVLKRSGFTLAQINGLLSSAASTIASLLGERIAALQSDLADKAKALHSMQAIARRMDSASTLNVDQLLESITMTGTAPLHAPDSSREAMLVRGEQFFATLAPDQQTNLREQLGQRLESLDANQLEAIQRPWRELSAQIRATMAAGTAARDPGVAPLAQRWHAWASDVGTRHPGFIAKCRELYLKHPELMVEQSMSPALIDYMHEAVAAAGLSELA